MALRHQLRADDDVDAAFRDLVQLAAHGLDRGDQVARQHHGARVRKQLRRLFLQPLDAGTDRDQRFLRRAMRTDVRARHREAAMVADQPLAKAVIHQPGVADGAGEAMPAGAAQRQRRIAAAVEEQQRLLAPLDRDPDLLGQPRRDEAAARRRLAAQIDRLDMRHVLAAEARRQHDALIAALARIDLGLDRRRRGRQHDRDFGDMRAHHRHVAGVIMRAVVLLVGLVVLFIDHDQPEIGVGQKQRRARADHDLRFAGRDRRPVARAGARRQFGMPFQRPHAETLRKAIEELSGQRDLRHQDQRLLAAADDFGDRLEIDFGLARAGDAVEQRDVKTAVRRQRPHRIDRGALLAAKNPAAQTTDRAPAAPAAAASPRSSACPHRPGRRSRRR